MTTLPKLNSNLLPWPTDWKELFGTDKPLILEIGFGHGQFLLHLASTYPDHNIIGLEISNRCLSRVETLLERKHVSNCRVIHSTAETALTYLLQPATLSQVYINFPDPWFKSSHGHRRLMQRDTLDALVNRLAPDGKLYLATDIIEYAEMSTELLAATPGLDNLLDAPWVNAMDGRVITKYEKKAHNEGRACYYFAYQRNHQPAPDVPPGKELDMPHLVFNSPLSFDEMLAQFKPDEVHEDATHINVIRIYRGEGSLLIETYIKEAAIDQRVAFMLLNHQQKPNEYTLQLSPLGHPRPTEGIHKAAGLIGKWVLSLHPEVHLIKHSIQTEQVDIL